MCSWRGLSGIWVFMKGLEQRRFSIELGQRSTEFKLYLIEVRRVNTIIPSSTWVGAIVPAELKDMYQIVMYIPWGGTGSLFHSLSCCFLTDSPLLLHSFVPLRGTLRSLIMENCSRVCTVARFRSQNGLGPKCHLLCQENYAWFSFSRDPPPYLLNKSTCTGTWRAGNLRRLNSSFVGSNAYSRWWVSEWDWIVGPPVGISDSLLEPGKNFGGTGL